jgi:hypothetical protein
MQTTFQVALLVGGQRPALTSPGRYCVPCATTHGSPIVRPVAGKLQLQIDHELGEASDKLAETLKSFRLGEERLAGGERIVLEVAALSSARVVAVSLFHHSPPHTISRPFATPTINQ